MLLKELRGERYVKSQHNKDLAAKLNARPRGSVEFKHQNISAILLEMEIPYIDGYKPRMNYQGILRDVVVEFVDQHRDELQQIVAAAPSPEPPALNGVSWESILVDPPEFVPSTGTQAVRANKTPRKWNFSEQEARNRKLGRLGEEFVLEYERKRLEQAGKKDLARRIEWVAEKDDSAGFDILSFDDERTERFVEVKTTNYGRSFPFMISQNEVGFSRMETERYALYRLFTFRTEPRLFILNGDIAKHCNLEPKTFRASFGKVA